MIPVYFYCLPFFAIAILFIFFDKTKSIGIAFIMSCIFLFPLSYALHDHFYFWKNKNSEQYIKVIERLICININKDSGDVGKIESVLQLIKEPLMIKSKGRNIYSTYSETDKLSVNKERTYKCGNYDIYIDSYTGRGWYKTYFYYFRALLKGEVFNFSTHKYWDFAVLHFALVMFFFSLILYRINVMQDNILTSIEKVVEHV